MHNNSYIHALDTGLFTVGAPHKGGKQVDDPPIYPKFLLNSLVKGLNSVRLLSDEVNGTRHQALKSPSQR